MVMAIALCRAPLALAQNDTLISIGVLAFRGLIVAQQQWLPTATYLSAHIDGYSFEIVPLTLDGTRAALDAESIDLILTNPGHFHALESSYRLAPLVTLRSDRAGQPRTGNRFGSVIFTRTDHTGIANLSDLRGHSLAAVANDAYGGFQVASHTLRQNGIDPERDLSQIIYLGFPHARIIKAVLDGTADAGVVRSGILEAMIDAGELAPGALRVLNPKQFPGFDPLVSTNLSPEWTLGTTAALPEAARRQIALALLAMPEEAEAARLGNYGGWTTPMNDEAVVQIIAGAQPAQRPRPLDRFGWFSLMVLLGGALAGAVLVSLWQRSLPPAPAAPQNTPPDVHLTRREAEILAKIQSGLTTKEIARELGISPKTVEFHRTHLMRKFDVRNMAELVHRAQGKPA